MSSDGVTAAPIAAWSRATLRSLAPHLARLSQPPPTQPNSPLPFILSNPIRLLSESFALALVSSRSQSALSPNAPVASSRLLRARDRSLFLSPCIPTSSAPIALLWHRGEHFSKSPSFQELPRAVLLPSDASTTRLNARVRSREARTRHFSSAFPRRGASASASFFLSLRFPPSLSGIALR